MDAELFRRPPRQLLAGLLILILALSGAAQEADSAQEASSTEEAAPADEHDYSYVIDEKGKPVFTQRIRWQGDPNALRYEFVLYDASGAELDRRELTEDHLELHLSPGSYRYKITLFNLLDQVEYESDLLDLTVERAEIPMITSVKPAAIYLEEGKPSRIEIEGELIMPGAAISLVDQDKRSKTKDIGGIILSQEGSQSAVVEFPKEALQFGSYLLRVYNPGGLTGEADRPIKVRYQKPLDFYASLDYVPLIPLYDTFYKDNWADTIYPLGGGARVGLYFVKRRNLFLGAEVQGTIRKMNGGIAEATIETTSTTLGLNLVGAWRFMNVYRLVARVGGGMNGVALAFDYEGTSGDSMESHDPYATAGLSLQWFFHKRFYAELGADWFNVFRTDYMEGETTPRASVGFYY